MHIQARLNGLAALCVATGLACAAPLTAAPIAKDAAPIALLVDVNSGQTLFARDARRKFVPASITKVMTAMVAFERIANGQLDPEAVVTVDDLTFEEWSGTGSSMFLRRAEEVQVGRLLAGITSVSANDAAILLARSTSGSVEEWVGEMNLTAQSLGMGDTGFGTPNGWPDNGRTYTTARDLVTLASAMISRHRELYATYFGREGLAHNGIAQANYDPITGKVPGADGIKTGFTREAGYTFLGSAERDGRRLVMVIAGAPSEDIRAQAARNLIGWGFDSFAEEKVLSAGETVGRARVQGGDRTRIAVGALDDVSMLVPANDEIDMEMTLEYLGPLPAPITSGEQVAWLKVSMDGIPAHRVPLYSLEEAKRANPFQRIVSAFRGWFGA